MEFFLPLYMFPDARVKPLVILSKSYDLIQQVVNLLPSLVRQDLITLMNGGSVPSETRPFMVLNADFAAILSYSQYKNSAKIFSTDPGVNLYSLDVTVVDDSTDFRAIADAVKARADLVPPTLKEWLANPWPKALVLHGRRATDAFRNQTPPNLAIYESNVFAMAGISGVFDPPSSTQVVNLRSPTLHDVHTFWNGLLHHLTRKDRTWSLVASIGGPQPGQLPARMQGTAVLLSDADFQGPNAPRPVPALGFPSDFVAQMFQNPLPPSINII